MKLKVKRQFLYPHQNSCSSWPWNRLAPLGMVKETSENIITQLLQMAKKFIHKIYLKQLFKQAMCTFHTNISFSIKWSLPTLLKHYKKPWRAPTSISPKMLSLGRHMYYVFNIPVTFGRFSWIQELQAGEGSCASFHTLSILLVMCVSLPWNL